MPMRFYLEEQEVDVQDPSFFFDEEELHEIQESIEELLDYV